MKRFTIFLHMMVQIMNNPPGKLRTAVDQRRNFLISRLSKLGFDTIEQLSSYTLSDLESANITHMANLGKVMEQLAKVERNG